MFLNGLIMDKDSLDRFVKAQESSYSDALLEISSGRKRSHWIWYIFPQLRGLGRSNRSEYYGISDKDEALCYLSHPILGSRLREISTALYELDGCTINEIMGYPDNLKLFSSMTLFDVIAPNDIFEKVLRKYFDGRKDSVTLSKLDV
jgi:uncharacterized protein (DUF1810 family)